MDVIDYDGIEQSLNQCQDHFYMVGEIQHTSGDPWNKVIKDQTSYMP